VTVQATIDGQTIINGLKVSEVPCCSVREDVAQMPAAPPQARLSGFALVFNVNYLSEGTHLVVITAQDDRGSAPQQESRTFSVVKPGGFTLLNSLLIDKDTKVELSTDKKEVLVTGAVATDNDTGSAQAVNLQLGWQEASQSFGVISAQNVGKPTAGGSGEEGSGDNDVEADDNTRPPITVTIEILQRQQLLAEELALFLAGLLRDLQTRRSAMYVPPRRQFPERPSLLCRTTRRARGIFE